MKKSIIFVSFLFIQSLLFAQGFNIIATADNGKKDTVSIGYKTNASIGVDAGLGEADISNQVLKEVDLRVVQRDSINFSCSYTFSPIFRYDTFRHFFRVKFDSKSNFRSRTDTSFLNRLFEVKFFTKNVKKISFIPWQDSNIPNLSALDTFDFFIDSCLNKVNQNLAAIIWDPTSSAPASINGANYFSNLILVFKKRTLTQVNQPTELADFKLFPNPTKGKFTIENTTKLNISEVKLFDLLGHQVYAQKIDFGERIEVDVSSLANGSYFMSIFDVNSRNVFNKMVVKNF
jgi:hypothetical protein